MSSIDTLREFLGWCTVINMGLVIVTSVFLGAMRGMITGILSKMFGLSEDDLLRSYFGYVAQYKIAVIVFNFVPYIALVFMT